MTIEQYRECIIRLLTGVNSAEKLSNIHRFILHIM